MIDRNQRITVNDILAGVNEDTEKRYMIPMMSKKSLFVYRLLVGIWVATTVNFWIWWFQQDHFISLPGITISSLLLFWTIMLPGYFYYFAGRVQRPNPKLFIEPDKKVAMVVTKAPSEPWEIVQRTLMAMKNQDYPYKFDIWLADEAPNREVIEWCEENHIYISTRHDFNIFSVGGYQNEEFPRRARSKEGNLSFFYDNFGEYDFVSQLDADHVPSSTYLKEIIRPFANPQVGYVAAPSICDANADESWVVNGRLFVEAPFHGAMQGGYNGRWAPIAIGSHYAVRVNALKNLVHARPKTFWSREFIVVIGGLGAELAEDHVTSLAMISRGYEGAFAIDAIAHGDGPPSILHSMTQEMQWSRSLMMVLMRWTYSYFKFGSTPRRIKFQFLFLQFWYPIFAFHLFLSYQMPNIALLAKSNWVNMSYGTFLLYFLPTLIASVIPMIWLQRLGLLRPANAPAASWEMTLFTLVRWPWALWGCIQGIIGVVILNRELKFKVTPKGVTKAHPLPIKVLLPYAALVLVSAGVCLAVADAKNAAGYYALSLLDAATYTLVIWILVILHYRENRAKLEQSALRFFAKPLILTIMVTIVLIAVIILRWQAAYGAIVS